MNIGLFNKRITIQKPNENTKDASGFKLPDDQKFTDFITTWAMVKTTIVGKEVHDVGTTLSENIVRFVIRYRSGIEPNMRINHNGKFYEILSVINDDLKNTTLTIVTKEVI